MTQSYVPTNRTAALCAFVATLKYGDIPIRVVERTADLLLDHLGVSLHASTLPWCRIIRDFTLSQEGPGISTMYGYGAALPRDAALVNATAAHGIELDDTHDASMSHPGAVVIPVALAVAEARCSNPQDLLAAIVAGYEAQCRAGSAASDALIDNGFHPTAAAGVFGATAAAARLLGLSAQQLEAAFGLALSMVSGTIQFTEDPCGTMVKRLHAGIPAQNGILCAELAARGFQGPHSALDGRYGFVRLFARHQSNFERLSDHLGERWVIDEMSVKLYACCRLFHSFIDSIRSLRAEGAWSANDVASISVLGPKGMLDGRLETRPASVMSAQYSLPYVTAATLLLDPCNPSSFAEEIHNRPDVLSMIDLVKPEHAPELDSYFPARCPGGVRITLKSGKVLERTVIDSVGTPAQPVNRAGIKQKYTTLTAGLLDCSTQAQVADAVFSLNRQQDSLQLMGLLRESIHR